MLTTWLRAGSSLLSLNSPQTRRNIGKGLWGLSDHALMSATNFATMVLIARTVSPREFGLYSLAYMGLLFANSLQSALIIQPHTILGATRSGNSYVRYTTDTAWSQIGFAVFTALITSIFALIARSAGWWVAPLLIALVPATAAWQLQEFMRRTMYTTSQPYKAFLNDLVSYGGQLAIIIVLWRTHTLTPVAALLTLAATSFLGALFGFWQIRSSIDRKFTISDMRQTIGANWSFGKWLLGGNIAFWTSGQIYPVLTAGLVSVSATGALRAAQTILGPMNVFMISLNPLFGPKAAREFAQHGKPALQSLLNKLQVLILAVIGCYCLTVAVFAAPLLRFVYGSQYEHYSWILTLVAILTLVSALRAPVKIGLNALGETNAIFRTYLASSAINLTLGVAAIYFLGLKGVAVGLILNSITIQIMMWRYQNRFIGGKLFGNRIPNRSRNTPSEAREHGRA